MERLKNGLLSVFLLLSTSVLLVLLVEGGSFLFFRVRDRLNRRPGVTDDYRVAGFPTVERGWAQEFFRETARCERNPSGQSNMRWRPYSYWRLAEFHGKHINVDAQGLRRTSNPDCRGKGKRVFFFGGSTAWGFGADDDATIPSLVSKELNGTGDDCYEVTNFSQLGYVSTQSLVALQQELQRGNVPNFVIFYDGVNDVASAYENGEAGIPENEDDRREEFNSLEVRKEPLKEFFNSCADFVRRTNTFRMAVGIRRLLDSGKTQLTKSTDPANHTYTDEELSRLARGVVQTYRSNTRIVEALGRDFHFTSFFFWQPVIFFAGNLSPYEAQEMRKGSKLEPLYRLTYGIVSESEGRDRSPGGGFVDLQRVLAGKTAPVFLDYMHLKKEGNAVVAHAMVKVISEGEKGFQRSPRT